MSSGDSKVFLQNRLARSRGKLSEVRPVIQTKGEFHLHIWEHKLTTFTAQEVTKLHNLAAQLDANPSLGKADEVVDVRRRLCLFRAQC